MIQFQIQFPFKMSSQHLENPIHTALSLNILFKVALETVAILVWLNREVLEGLRNLSARQVSNTIINEKKKQETHTHKQKTRKDTEERPTKAG